MVQPDFLKDILKKLGWNEGFQIPIANDENKALEAQVAKLTLAKLKAKSDNDLATQKLEALERHFKFISQESDQVEKLISAHKQQFDTENHRLRVATAEKSSLIQDIRENCKNVKDIKEKINEKRGEVRTNMEKIDKIKKETFWDEEALKAWEESLKKRDDDNNILMKFSKQDEKKFLELEAKRASLQIEYMQRQKTVEKMVNDLHNYESVLERTGKTIKKQVAERDSLVAQWKETVKILHQRDDAISAQQDKMLDTIELIETEKETMKNEENLLKIEKNNNRELERDNDDLNSQHSRCLRELERVIQQVLFFNSEENSMKRQVTKTANNLENERCRAKTLKRERESKLNEISNVEKKIEILEKKYENLKIANMSVADRCKHLEKLISFEMKQHHVLLGDSDRLSQTLYREQTKLSDQVEISRSREMEISKLATIIDGLQKMTKEAQTNMDQKKEIIYNMEFRIDQLEEKLSSLEKQKNNEGDEDGFNKIKMLEKEYAECSETKCLLQEQISRIQDEMRRLTTAIAHDEEKLAILNNKLQTEKLNYEGGVKQVAAAKAAAQEKQVEENILILKLKQFDHNMKKEDNEIYNLQKMKLNLEQAMRERDLEVKGKMELLQVQKRNLDEDRGRLRTDYKNRQIKVDQLQSKYDLVSMSLGTDEDGQTLSVTHFKLKVAQDKYFLKQKGDVLDEKIKKIEKEIVAMENTLRIVNLTNAAYKRSLSEVDDTDNEVQTMQSLEKRYIELVDQQRTLRDTLMSEKQNLKDLKKEMEELKEIRQDLEQSFSELELEYNKIQNELKDKQDKVKRTENLIKKVVKKLPLDILAKYDRDLEVQQMSEANKNGLQKLCHLAITDYKLRATLENLAKENNITLPEMKVLSSRFSDASLSSSDIQSTLSSDLKSSKDSVRSRTGSSYKGNISPSCHCSSSSSVSVSNLVLSFDNAMKK